MRRHQIRAAATVVVVVVSSASYTLILEVDSFESTCLPACIFLSLSRSQACFKAEHCWRSQANKLLAHKLALNYCSVARTKSGIDFCLPVCLSARVSQFCLLRIMPVRLSVCSASNLARLCERACVPLAELPTHTGQHIQTKIRQIRKIDRILPETSPLLYKKPNQATKHENN